MLTDRRNKILKEETEKLELLSEFGRNLPPPEDWVDLPVGFWISPTGEVYTVDRPDIDRMKQQHQMKYSKKYPWWREITIETGAFEGMEAKAEEILDNNPHLLQQAEKDKGRYYRPFDDDPFDDVPLDSPTDSLQIAGFLYTRIGTNARNGKNDRYILHVMPVGEENERPTITSEAKKALIKVAKQYNLHIEM